MEDLPSIKDQLNRKDLFDAFKRQLAKDFEQSNFPADFADDLEPDYAIIHEKISLELQHGEKKTDLSLMHLLYRIDISEAQLKRYLHEYKNENHINVIADLIIKRVLQKVIIKQFYKDKKDSWHTNIAISGFIGKLFLLKVIDRFDRSNK